MAVGFASKFVSAAVATGPFTIQSDPFNEASPVKVSENNGDIWAAIVSVAGVKTELGSAGEMFAVNVALGNFVDPLYATIRTSFGDVLATLDAPGLPFSDRSVAPLVSLSLMVIGPFAYVAGPMILFPSASFAATVNEAVLATPAESVAGMSVSMMAPMIPPRATGKLFGPANVTVPDTLFVERRLPVPFAPSYVVSVKVCGPIVTLMLAVQVNVSPEPEQLGELGVRLTGTDVPPSVEMVSDRVLLEIYDGLRPALCDAIGTFMTNVAVTCCGRAIGFDALFPPQPPRRAAVREMPTICFIMRP